MIDSYSATTVIVAFLVCFCIVIPILDKIPFIRSFISLRWIVTIAYTGMALGCILNFSHLDTSVRLAVVVGGILLSAIFLLVRSFEKMILLKGNIPHLRAELQKGDLRGELSVSSKTKIPSIEKENNSPQSKSINLLSNYVSSKNEEEFDQAMNETLYPGEIQNYIELSNKPR